MANVIFMDGFDAYDFTKNNSAAPNLASKWIIVNNLNLGGTTGRYGGQAVRLGDTYSSTTIRAYFNGNIYQQTATLAFAFSTNDVARSDRNGQCVSLMHGQASQFGLGITNIGEICLYRGNTVVAISVPNLIHTNDWHYIELEYVGHSNAGRATCYLDGAPVVEFTGNTQNQNPYGINGLQLSCETNGSEFRFDDMYVTDSATRLGERRIETLRPNGDAGVQFQPNFGNVNFVTLNEPLVSADTFVSSSTVGAKDLYNFDNLSTTPSKIDAVQLSVWATKTDAETRQIQTIIKSGTVEDNSPDYNLPSTHMDANRIILKDPATGADWTPSGVNAIQGGFKITR